MQKYAHGSVLSEKIHRKTPTRGSFFKDGATFSEDFENNYFNPLSANPEKWSNTLKQIVGNLPTICLSVFDHFMILALKGLKNTYVRMPLKIQLYFSN